MTEPEKDVPSKEQMLSEAYFIIATNLSNTFCNILQQIADSAIEAMKNVDLEAFQSSRMYEQSLHQENQSRQNMFQEQFEKIQKDREGRMAVYNAGLAQLAGKMTNRGTRVSQEEQQ